MTASWPKQSRGISASAVSVRAALRAGAKPVGNQPARQLCERIVLFRLPVIGLTPLTPVP
jgi:hypothetical protein